MSSRNNITEAARLTHDGNSMIRRLALALRASALPPGAVYDTCKGSKERPLITALHYTAVITMKKIN